MSETAITDEARFAQLKALERIGRELNSTLHIDQLLDVLVEQAVRFTPAGFSCVLVFDRRQGDLRLRAWCSRAERDADMVNVSLEVETVGTVCKVFRIGQQAVIADVRQDPEALPMVPETTRSMFVAPIRYAGEIVGVLDLESEQVGAFGPETHPFVRAVAEQAAVAIGNARRYAEQVERENVARQRNEQLRDLISISHVLHTGHSLADVLDQIVQNVGLAREGEDPICQDT